MTEQRLVTIAQAAEALEMPENTIRKYLNEFDLHVDKSGRRSMLSEATVRCLLEIIQLKNNGWSLKQIKALRDSDSSVLPSNITLGSTPEVQSSDQLIKEDLSQKALETAQVQVEASLPDETVVPEVLVTELLAEQKVEPVVPQPAVITPTLQPEFPPEQATDFIEARSNDSAADLPLESPSMPETQAFEPSGYSDDSSNIQAETSSQDAKRHPLTKDFVNREIGLQAKRVARLKRFLSARLSPRDSIELRGDLDRRYEFLAGLRYIRDNWVERKTGGERQYTEREELQLAGSQESTELG